MRLHLQAHLADFVQEDRALMREFQPPDPIPIGAGEAPFGVTEEFRLEERLNHRTTVHRDEASIGAPRVGMDELRDEILADTAFAGNEDLHVGSTAARVASTCTWRMARLAPTTSGPWSEDSSSARDRPVA